MGEFDAIRAKGIALIKKKGRPIQILIGGDAAPVDPTKPWNVAKTAPTIVACTAVVVDFSGIKVLEGVATKTCLIPGDCGLFEIDESMRINVLAKAGTGIPDRVYAIEAITVYEPDGLPIGWKLRLSTWPRTSPTQQTKF